MYLTLKINKVFLLNFNRELKGKGFVIKRHPRMSVCKRSGTC